MSPRITNISTIRALLSPASLTRGFPHSPGKSPSDRWIARVWLPCVSPRIPTTKKMNALGCGGRGGSADWAKRQGDKRWEAGGRGKAIKGRSGPTVVPDCRCFLNTPVVWRGGTPRSSTTTAASYTSRLFLCHFLPLAI